MKNIVKVAAAAALIAASASASAWWGPGWGGPGYVTVVGVTTGSAMAGVMVTSASA
jgi:hypothetical protein